MATETLSYSEATALLNSSLAGLHDSTAVDGAVVEGSLYPGALGVLDTMRRYNVDELSVGAFDREDPREVLETVFEAAQSEFDERGIPHPDLDLYRSAVDYSRGSDVPMSDVMAQMDGALPYGVQQETADGSEFTVSPADTVTMALSGPLMGAVQAEPPVGLDAAAQNYQEYDVHLMAYPLAELPFGIESRDSHAFVVVTEKGGNPYDLDDALLVTRGGPDNNGAFGSSESSSGSSFGDEQDPNEKGNDGDVYVSSPSESRSDIRDSAFLLERTTITGDIDQIRSQVADFREFINGQDIDYVPTNLFGEGSNSNTYAGDAYELLTGDEPNNPHHGVFSGRRTPALENDLVNYEETEYAPYFD